ncbi:MAG: hypothetical protein LBM38_02990 [Clostridiales bacterium]|jgi:hypothetical protein|nr:hypothetical protein [Clostridiales bacterium]
MQFTKKDGEALKKFAKEMKKFVKENGVNIDSSDKQKLKFINENAQIVKNAKEKFNEIWNMPGKPYLIYTHHDDFCTVVDFSKQDNEKFSAKVSYVPKGSSDDLVTEFILKVKNDGGYIIGNESDSILFDGSFAKNPVTNSIMNDTVRITDVIRKFLRDTESFFSSDYLTGNLEGDVRDIFGFDPVNNHPINKSAVKNAKVVVIDPSGDFKIDDFVKQGFGKRNIQFFDSYTKAIESFKNKSYNDIVHIDLYFKTLDKSSDIQVASNKEFNSIIGGIKVPIRAKYALDVPESDEGQAYWGPTMDEHYSTLGVNFGGSEFAYKFHFDNAEQAKNIIPLLAKSVSFKVPAHSAIKNLKTAANNASKTSVAEKTVKLTK